MVARGKFAEGMNFKGDLARGIFLIGVPHLNIKDPKIKMKERFYKECSKLLFSLGKDIISDTYDDYYFR